MPSNKISRDQSLYLRIPKLAPDRPSSYTRTHWGDRGPSRLPSQQWYNSNRTSFGMFNGTSLVGGVHRDALCIFEALNHVMRQVDYHPIPKQNWGGNRRLIRGTKPNRPPSIHASLAACDISSGVNPFSRNFQTDMPVEMIQGIYQIKSVASGHPAWVWGGVWTRTKDSMHFQASVSPAELAQGVVTGDGSVFLPSTKPAVYKPTGKPGFTVLKLGSKHANVAPLQELLIRYGHLPAGTADGSFGPMTKAAVIAFQRRIGTTADGLWGRGSETKAREFLAAEGVGLKPPLPTGNKVTADKAEEIVTLAYRLELGRAPDAGGLAHFAPVIAAGKYDLDDLRQVLDASDEGRRYQMALSERRVKEAREAVLASFAEQFGRQPSAKELTVGMTKVTSTLATAWG